ncbi:MAG: YoaK family protein [Gluconobacter sp.]
MSPSLMPIAVSARRIFILGLVAGYVDALSFVDLGGVFAGAMTGNTTHMGASFIQENWSHGFLLVGALAIFFASAILTSLARLLWLPAYGIVFMTILMVLAQAAHSSPYRYWGEFLILPTLLAVQGETIAKFSGTSMPTIVITTNLLKAASGIATWVAAKLAPSRVGNPLSGSILLPGLSFLSFLMGAVMAALGLAMHGSFPFLWPLPFLALLYWDVWRTERDGRYED